MPFIGALLGALLCLLVQNILYPICVSRYRRARERRLFAAVNKSWSRFQALFPNLRLLQSGWPPTGLFEPRHIICHLVGVFELPPTLRTQIRERHASEWIAKRLTDGEQVGIRNLRIFRHSDDPGDERVGRSHSIEIEAHVYHYFDFLATHRLIANGSAEERSLLTGFAVETNPEQTIAGFPNPLSVGLSLFCEQGQVLALVVRTKVGATGGLWQGGKVFNAVGENFAPRDFSLSLSGEAESSPIVVGRRGLYEEVGLSEDEIDGCTIAFHSVAWASDILDHKFFGYAITPLAQAQVQARWENAPDRSENRQIQFARVATPQDCRFLWRKILASSDQWSPEAIFCTARSLVLLRKLTPSDLTSSPGVR